MTYVAMAAIGMVFLGTSIFAKVMAKRNEAVDKLYAELAWNVLCLITGALATGFFLWALVLVHQP